MQEGRICSKCNELKPRKEFHECFYKDRTSTITPRCKKCRSLTYRTKKYPTTCIQCLEPNKLNSNKICSKCNESSGLRECNKCHNILPILLMFSGRKKDCKNCRKIKQPLELVL